MQIRQSFRKIATEYEPNHENGILKKGLKKSKEIKPNLKLLGKMHI